MHAGIWGGPLLLSAPHTLQRSLRMRVHAVHVWAYVCLIVRSRGPITQVWGQGWGFGCSHLFCSWWQIMHQAVAHEEATAQHLSLC